MNLTFNDPTRCGDVVAGMNNAAIFAKLCVRYTAFPMYQPGVAQPAAWAIEKYAMRPDGSRVSLGLV